jgi:pyruvyltransferase
MFIYYEYLMNNVCFDNILKYEYLMYNNIQNKGLKYDNNTQVICINDINNTIYNVNEICDYLTNISNINKVALCAIGKNENLYIREWVEHYKNIGISKIFLYDNNDIDGEHFEDVINDYVKSGFVEIINVRGIWPAQIDAYESFYHSDKSTEYSWILFCDIDEFLEFPDKYTSVSQFVSNKIFNDYDVIKVCWKCYDDNDLVYVKDNNYSIKRFKKPAINQPYTNSQTKMFLRTNRDAHIISPHGALTKNGYNEHLKVCNTRGEQIKNNDIMYTTGDPMAYVHDNCWLNHYRFKTIEEYIIKTKRGWPTIYMNGGKQYMNARFFFLHNKYTREKHKLFAKLLNRDYISITTYGSINQNKNWGDDINFSFIQELLDYKYECINVNKNMNEDNYAFIGSILEDTYLTPSTIVWGAGIPDKDQIINIKPKKILAVRGPLTRKKLLEQGIKCPAVYGDPALLIHLIYNPQIEKKYKLGIIPHFSNLTNKKLNEAKKNPNIKIINLKIYKGCWKNVIDDILSCEYIISESLHGLIISESYKIPNLWINIEDTPNKNKGIFKYLDFYHSIGKTNIKNYIDISDYNDLPNIIETINNNWYYRFNINLNKLIDACPFKIELKPLNNNINTNNNV